MNITTISPTGARYTPPREGAPVFANTPLEFTATDGQIFAPLTLAARLRADHTFTFTPAQAALTIDLLTGIARGTMRHPTLGSVPLTGITLQPENAVRGFFLVPGETGAFDIRRLVAPAR